MQQSVRRFLPITACIALYSGAAICLFYRPGLLDGREYFGTGTDPFLYIWMFKFLPAALAHLQNPLLLPQAWAPYGLNITQATTTPLLALLAWPLTSWAGPVIAFNLVTLAAPALAATAACLLAFELTSTWAPAFIAGWIFGFSSAVFGPMLNHLQTDFTAFIPISFLLLTLRARGKLSTTSYVWYLAAAGLCQFLISLETYVTLSLFLIIFSLIARRKLLPGLAMSFALTFILAAPFIYEYFQNYAAIPHIMQNAAEYVTDLANFIIPTRITWLGGNLATPISRQFLGNPSEQLGYVGAPLALITAIAARNMWHDAAARPFIICLILALILTLGDSLHIAGIAMAPLPWLLIGKLPLIANALPARLMIFADLFIGIICAIWLSRLAHRRLGDAALAAALILTLPASRTSRGADTNWHSPTPTATLFQSDLYRNDIARNAIVLFLPFTPTRNDALFWQTITNGYFRTINGYGDFTPPELAASPAVAILQSPNPIATTGNIAQINLFLTHNDVSAIIIPAAMRPQWAGFFLAAGWQPQDIDQLTIFTRPPPAIPLVKNSAG